MPACTICSYLSCLEIDNTFCLTVDTTNIQRQFSVYKYINVIVTGEEKLHGFFNFSSV